MEAGSDIDGAFRPRRASEWLLALRERPEDADLKRRFADWLAADAANRTDWTEISRTHAVMGRVSPRHADRWAAQPVLRSDPDIRIVPFQARRSRWRRAAVGLAMAAGVAASVVLTISPSTAWRFTADHATSTREVSTIQLSDGSTVRLGPESALDVAFTAGARDVRLLRGSAFFEVTKDPARPFRVAAGMVEARVLGTEFEVELDEAGAGVAVRHGTVQVEALGQPGRKLTAGDWIRVAARDGAVTGGNAPPAQVAPWLDGRLIAKDRPAGEVIDALRHYYSGLVIVRGDHLTDQPLTGVYDLSDPVAALNAVAGALGAKVTQISPWIFVLSTDGRS